MHDVVLDVAISIASKGKHAFMVSHDVNSKEFPRRTSYEKYSHVSIVANRFDELPEPVLCLGVEFLMLKLVERPFKLLDGFFVGMSELKVLSMRGGRYYGEFMHPVPTSVRLLANLRTLFLIDLKLDDISIIGELVNLEIFSIRDSRLEVLPVEIGKLTNLIMLEFWNEDVSIKKISPGVLSRLVRLEERYVVRVDDCSYSILREMESLSKLTALTFIRCSADVIHMNLCLSSKLTRYHLRVGQNPKFRIRSLPGMYDRIMDLWITENTPLGDWVRYMLRKSELVRSTGNGSKNVLSELLLDGFQNMKDLCLGYSDSLTHLLKVHCQSNTTWFPKLERLDISDCDRLEYLFSLPFAGSLSTFEDTTAAFPDDEEKQISSRTHAGPEEKMVQVIKFPNLYQMELAYLKCLTHFSDDTVEGIDFPRLRILSLSRLPKFQNFLPTAINNMLEGNSSADSNPLFHEKVSCPSLEQLELEEAHSITALCSHQLPTGYFNKLDKLEIWKCGKLRHLMSPSVARGAVNLRLLWIRDCPSIEEVITEDGQGEVTNESLFPRLEELVLNKLPKLRQFSLSKNALEFPFLKKVNIYQYPEMKTFIQTGSMTTPRLELLHVRGKTIGDPSFSWSGDL